MPDINQIGHDAESAIVGEMVGCSFDDLTEDGFAIRATITKLESHFRTGDKGWVGKDDVELLVFDAVVEAALANLIASNPIELCIEPSKSNGAWVQVHRDHVCRITTADQTLNPGTTAEIEQPLTGFSRCSLNKSVAIHADIHDGIFVEFITFLEHITMVGREEHSPGTIEVDRRVDGVLVTAQGPKLN